MTLTNAYATLAEVKLSVVGNITTTDASRDTLIEQTIEGVSREIDRMTGRRFWVDGSDVVRYFTPRTPYRVDVNDLVSVTSIAFDDGQRTWSNTLLTTEYELWPYNSAQAEVEPYQRINLIPTLSTLAFYRVDKGVKVTGKFGWSAVPKAIATACILQSHRIYSRYKTPLGVSASSALGEIKVSIPALDPDVQALISPYKRLT